MTSFIQVESYYRRRREAALRELLQRLAGEEQAAVARMVEKHSNEMIQLIRKKVTTTHVLNPLRAAECFKVLCRLSSRYMNAPLARQSVLARAAFLHHAEPLVGMILGCRVLPHDDKLN